MPWLTVRRVSVRVSSPSGHDAIIKFNGGVKAEILGRISLSPLSEWHAFDIISDNKEGHLMVAGVAGDFTRSLVTHPPTHPWVRIVHFTGVSYLTNMYNRVLLVATGSSIVVFLSFIMQPCEVDVRLICVTKGVEKNFGEEIMEWVSGSETIVVHDTSVLGRLNMAEMTVEAAQDIGQRW